MQIPDPWRCKKVLIRADGAGYSYALITAVSQQGLDFSVGYPVTDAVRDAIRLAPAWAWQVASNADGLLREHADGIEITDLLDLSRWSSTCPGHAGHRPKGTTAPRRDPGRLRGPRRLPLSGLHHQHPQRAPG